MDANIDDFVTLRLLNDMLYLKELPTSEIILKAYWLGKGLPIDELMNFNQVGIQEPVKKVRHLTLVK